MWEPQQNFTHFTPKDQPVRAYVKPKLGPGFGPINKVNPSSKNWPRGRLPHDAWGIVFASCDDWDDWAINDVPWHIFVEETSKQRQRLLKAKVFMDMCHIHYIAGFWSGSSTHQLELERNVSMEPCVSTHQGSCLGDVHDISLHSPPADSGISLQRLYGSKPQEADFRICVYKYTYTYIYTHIYIYTYVDMYMYKLHMMFIYRSGSRFPTVPSILKFPSSLLTSRQRFRGMSSKAALCIFHVPQLRLVLGQKPSGESALDASVSERDSHQGHSSGTSVANQGATPGLVEFP